MKREVRAYSYDNCDFMRTLFCEMSFRYICAVRSCSQYQFVNNNPHVFLSVYHYSSYVASNATSIPALYADPLTIEAQYWGINNRKSKYTCDRCFYKTERKYNLYRHFLRRHTTRQCRKRRRSRNNSETTTQPATSEKQSEEWSQAAR